MYKDIAMIRCIKISLGYEKIFAEQQNLVYVMSLILMSCLTGNQTDIF